MLRPRLIFAVAAVVVAALLAAALLVDPTDRGMSDSRDTGGSSAVAEATDPVIGAAADLKAPGAFEATADSAGGAALRAAPKDASIELEQSSADAAAPTTGIAAPDIDARIVRTGSIALKLKEGRFEDGWSDAQSVAGAFGGYVVNASRSGAGNGPRSGSITMRVPSERFDRAVDRLRDLTGAKVERLDVASQDVTQEFVDVRSRLKHDRAVEGRLLALLAQTKGVSEVLAVQSRLDQVQEQIEISRGRMQYLEKMTSMSTIEVALREPGAATKDAKDDESVMGEAWADARERFSENIAAAIVWTGGALPALGLLAMLALAGRLIWRRTQARRTPAAPVKATD